MGQETKQPTTLDELDAAISKDLKNPELGLIAGALTIGKLKIDAFRDLMSVNGGNTTAEKATISKDELLDGMTKGLKRLMETGAFDQNPGMLDLVKLSAGIELSEHEKPGALKNAEVLLSLYGPETIQSERSPGVPAGLAAKEGILKIESLTPEEVVSGLPAAAKRLEAKESGKGAVKQ